MKRLTSIIISAALCLSLAACGGGASSGSAGSPDTSPVIGEIGGEITVSCYDSHVYKNFLEEAARLFEEKYPGTTVKVETFSAMPEVKTMEQGDNMRVAMMTVEDDPQGRADYISRVNTSLMSGGGADIYAMDILPFYKYAESGQLENLDAYMTNDTEFNISDYRSNIFDSVSYQGGTWFLPMDYSFNYYAYDSTLLTEAQRSKLESAAAFTYEELIKIAAEGFDSSDGHKMFGLPHYGQMGGGLFGALLAQNYNRFVDIEGKEANFNDGSFAELLNSVASYADSGYILQGATGAEPESIMRRAGEAPQNRYYFKPKNNFSLLQFFNRDSSQRMMIAMAGSADGIDDDDELAGIQAAASGEIPFSYSQAYGINSNSANKTTAWAFLKFLLSEEIQLSTLTQPTALPVNNNARAKKAELTMSGGLFRAAAIAGAGAKPDVNPESAEMPELSAEQREVLQNYLEAVEMFSDQINSYMPTDTTIDDMINIEVGYFFDGTKSAEDVASALQNKAQLYLNE